MITGNIEGVYILTYRGSEKNYYEILHFECVEKNLFSIQLLSFVKISFRILFTCHLLEEF